MNQDAALCNLLKKLFQHTAQFRAKELLRYLQMHGLVISGQCNGTELLTAPESGQLPYLGSSSRQGPLQQAALVIEAPELVPVLVHGRHRAKVGLHPAMPAHLEIHVAPVTAAPKEMA